MAKPCAVFWDIQNVGIPRGQSANSIIKLIRSTIIKPHNLNEIFFFCVCDVSKLPLNVGQSLINLDVDIVQAYNEIKDSADIKIMDLMRKFVKLSGQDCTIILLSGDADYYGTLTDLKKFHNVSIHLIRLANSFSRKLDQISDYTYMLTNGILKSIKSNGSPLFFISVVNYPLSLNIKQVMNELNAQAPGSIGNSSILYNSLICIGFPTLHNAEKAIEKLNRSRYHRHFLKVELINDSLLTKILKCLKPKAKIYEVKTLTFVKMKRFHGELSPVLASLLDNQCILSSKSFLWIVHSYLSEAKKCLQNVQKTFPDAVISEPPIDLTYTLHESLYTVDLRYHKNPNAIIISYCELENSKKNESEMLGLFNRFTYILNSHDLKLHEKMSILHELCSLNGVNNLNLNFRLTNQWKLVFRHKTEASSHLSTKWSLIHNLFAQFYYLNARKVCFDGSFYWVHFDCEDSWKCAIDAMKISNLEPLKYTYSTDVNLDEITDQMNRYNFDNPWCFLPDLELYCYVIYLDREFHADFIDKSRGQLNNCECIFMKSFSGEIWLGFPDKHICKKSDKYVNRLLFNSRKPTKPIIMAQPSKELLESIELKDLIGEAYDLAFLSNELIISRKLNEFKNSKIIQQLNLQSTLFGETDQECDKPLFYVTVSGLRPNALHLPLDLHKIVKILVKLGKVIPMATITSVVPRQWSITRSTTEVSFIFSSWTEALTMSHYLRNVKLGYIDSPYTDPKVESCGLLTYRKLDSLDYFIINDQHKVLEKILDNKSLVDKLNSNSPAAQPISDIDELDDKIMRKFQLLFTIATNSEFGFTSGMISIIKMHLVQMECPVFIEFEDKIWVGVEDLKKGNKAKAKIEQIKFKILHEKDEDDFDIGLAMNLVLSAPLKVIQIMAKKLVNSTQGKRYDFTQCDIESFVPLGYFNYCHKKSNEHGMCSQL